MKLSQCLTVLASNVFALAADPGLPVDNPTISYWQIPPDSVVADHQSRQLPTQADVVIIGSGITGTSIAYHLLKSMNQDRPLKIAMLEARQTCSGATGRNGGHIRPSSYSEYSENKESLGRDEAAKITRMRAAHIDALIQAANELDEEGRRASEARVVDSIDGFFTDESYAEALNQLALLKDEVPDVGAEWTSWNQSAARNISLLRDITGILTGSPKIAAAIWPYRFVSHTLRKLLKDYPSFSLDTHTPATAVLDISDQKLPGLKYEVKTPRGAIRARHIVHAQNAWIPHLVPGLSNKIKPWRLHMSAQLGGSKLPKAGQWPSYSGNGSLSTGRAWSLFRGRIDYIVQMPRHGEYMFGGGNAIRPATFIDSWDDSTQPDHHIASYLNGALPDYFGYDKWGNEINEFTGPEFPAIFPGRTKRVWIGIEGRPWDGRPLVGMIPTTVTGRSKGNDALGAEWISAAYEGEGMCYAWLCGNVLTSMILNQEAGLGGNMTPSWFPSSLLMTEERLAKNSSGVSLRKRDTR